MPPHSTPQLLVDDGIVGRTAERHDLLEAAERARNGTPSVIIIDGEAGSQLHAHLLHAVV